MSTVAQILRLCAVAAFGSAAALVVRGVPEPVRPQAAAVGACLAPEPGPSGEVAMISQDQARSLAESSGVAFIDCRPRAEFEAGHVAGSIHVDESKVTAPLLASLASAQMVIAYCDADHQCARSFQVADRLRQAGLRDVRVLEGGMPAWLAHGFPAESGICGQCEGSP